MGKRINLLHHRFGKLLVIADAGVEWSAGHPRGRAEALWRCRCDCGNEITALSSRLRRGRLRSCGCLKEIHGHNRPGKRTRTYRSWVNMLTRCNNKNSRSYKDYGERGITVCDRWHTFENFLADMGVCPKGKSIERRDNNGNYEPSNCYWASTVEQANNKRRTVYITYQGERLPISRLAARFNIPANVFYERIIKYGWSIDDALTKPIIHRTANLTFEYRGQLYKLSELAKMAKVSKSTLYQRLRNSDNWTVEAAVETPVRAARAAA